MRIAIMQPYFFPYVGYFQLINTVEKFVILDDVNYINRGWINRNRILVNNKEHIFTIPLEKSSQNKLISEISILDNKKWKLKLLKTIEFAYKKAPFFFLVFPLIEDIILKDERNLSAFTYHSIINIKKYIGITTEIVPSSSKYKNNKLKADKRILDICKQESATQYINPIGGTELYSKELFLKNKVILNFLKPTEIRYIQFNSKFIPWLSIIDVMMFNSKETIISFLSKYELI